MTTDTTAGEIQSVRRLHVVFCHLDLGIGGAEQLILQLCQASKKAGHRLDIVTTRCDADHCFASVKPGGELHSYLHVWGRWIPATILGKAKAACSAIRVLYLAWRIAQKKTPDVIVLDVLPNALPFWQFFTRASLCFYCHFPDRLLVQSAKGNIDATSRSTGLYRRFLDSMEEWSMSYADEIAVNSNFTRGIVLEAFPRLKEGREGEDFLSVLYPALDTASLQHVPVTQKEPLLVSLNRFERKKNLQLVLEAAGWLREKGIDLPRIVLAGGYDIECSENVEYLAELEALAKELQINVEFQKSISDVQRSHLLRTATAVLYTPSHEHFGIVPLEAMYAETIVVANRSGGPIETIRDGLTGYLCDTPTAEDWGKALQKVLAKTPSELEAMGKAAKQRVEEKFSEQRLCREWNLFLEKTVDAGHERLERTRRLLKPKTCLYMVEGAVTVVVCWLLASGAKLLMWLVLFASSRQDKEEL